MNLHRSWIALGGALSPLVLSLVNRSIAALWLLAAVLLLLLSDLLLGLLLLLRSEPVVHVIYEFALYLALLLMACVYSKEKAG